MHAAPQNYRWYNHGEQPKGTNSETNREVVAASGAHIQPRRSIPAKSARAHVGALKERPDIGTPPTAGLAGEPGLEIGQPDVIAPRGGVDHDRVRAFEIGAIDDQPVRAVVGPHFTKGDLLFSWHYRRVRPSKIWPKRKIIASMAANARKRTAPKSMQNVCTLDCAQLS